MPTDVTARLDKFIANPRRAMWGMALPMLIGMSLLGASSAAVVFHDRVVRILGW